MGDLGHSARLGQSDPTEVVGGGLGKRTVSQEEYHFLLGLFEEQFVTGNDIDTCKAVCQKRAELRSVGHLKQLSGQDKSQSTSRLEASCGGDDEWHPNVGQAIRRKPKRNHDLHGS